MSDICNAMISLDKVSKSYSDKTVLKNVSFSLSSPGLYSIVGPSGSGKTTLLSLICGFEKPSSGTVEINGSIGYVFQESNLIPGFTALDNIKIVGVEDEKALSLLKEFGLEDSANKKVSLLSGGEKQRVAVARCLAMDSNILILDEPTGNLDKENAEYLFKTLKEISKNLIVLVVTHDKELADEYSDHLIRIEDGQVIYKEDNVTKQIEAQKKENKVLSNYSFKYALSLIKEKKSFFALSVVLLVLTLVLDFFSFGFFLFDAKEVVANTVESSSLPFYSLIKSVYNENDMTEYQYSNGKAAKDEIESLTGLSVSYCSYSRTKSEKKNITTKTQFVVVADDYQFSLCKGALPSTNDEVVITDFLAKFLFEEENPIGKTVAIDYGDFKVAGIQKTEFAEKDFEKYFTDISFQESHEDFVEKYLSLFVKQQSIIDSWYQKGEMMIRGGNFFFSNKGSQTFSGNNSLYARGSIVPGLSELKENEVVISTAFHNMVLQGADVIGKECPYLDLNSSINKNRLLGCVNLYDIYHTVKIVDVVDMEYDIATSDYFFKKITEEYLPFSFERIAVSNPTRSDIMTLQNHGYLVNGNPFYDFYGMGQLLNSVGEAVAFATAMVMVIVILVSILLFSSIISRKMHEIASLKCLGASNKKLFKVFSIYSLIAFLSSYVVAFVGAFVLRILFNGYMNSVFYPNTGVFIEILPFSIPVTLVTLCTCIVLAFGVIAIPMIKISKIEPAILLKKTL